VSRVRIRVFFHGESEGEVVCGCLEARLRDVYEAMRVGCENLEISVTGFEDKEQCRYVAAWCRV
jgi:hypothetical protein